MKTRDEVVKRLTKLVANKPAFVIGSDAYHEGLRSAIHSNASVVIEGASFQKFLVFQSDCNPQSLLNSQMDSKFLPAVALSMGIIYNLIAG